MSSHYYKEEQKMRQPWVFAILVLVFGVWVWQLVQQVIMGVPFGKNPSPDIAVILIGIIPLGVLWLILSFKLETTVDQEGVHYRMFPLMRKAKLIPSREIISWEVRKYNPIRDYGGWGIRYSFTRKGMAYNVRGNMGAYFELQSGRHILIGTQRPEEFRSALRKLLPSST